MATNDTKMGGNSDSNTEKCSDIASSSICETKGFEIQNRDMRNPCKAGFSLLCNFMCIHA